MTSLANIHDCQPCQGAGGDTERVCPDCNGTGTDLGVRFRDEERATVTTARGTFKAEVYDLGQSFHIEVRRVSPASRCFTEWTPSWRFRRLLEKSGRLEPGVEPELLEAAAVMAEACAARQAVPA